jgi:hypothetical protein
MERNLRGKGKAKRPTTREGKYLEDPETKIRRLEAEVEM